MRALSKYLGLFAILATTTVLRADDTVPPAAAAPPAAAPVSMTTQSQLSPAEMQAAASDIISQGHDAYQTVLALRESARKQQDAIRLNCINNKLVQLKAQLNIADNENSDLDALIGGNTDERFTVFANLKDTGAAVLKLREEAKACVGQVELLKQESGVLVTHPQFPDQPQPIDPYSGEVEPPAYASPFI